VCFPLDQGYRVQTRPRRLTFRDDKIRSTPSFGGGSKAGDPRRKILRYVKYHLQLRKKCLQGKILTSVFHSSYLIQEDCAGMMARVVWWTSQKLSPAGIISPWLSVLTHHLGDKQQTLRWPWLRDVVSPPST
jgi:hypothetical protein